MLALCNFEDKCRRGGVVSRKCITICFEEHNHRTVSSAFIAVQEWMIFAKKVDVAAIDCVTYALLLQHNYPLHKLRIIHKTKLAPAPDRSPTPPLLMLE